MWDLQAVVICGGDGVETVLLDRDGAPVDPEDCAHALCLDCIAVPALFAPGPDAAASAPARIDRAGPFAVVQHPAPSRRWSENRPRGPPTRNRD